jgi:uncharacterized protein (TIRG00374 family)
MQKKRIIGIVLLVIVIGLFVYYFKLNIEDFKEIRIVNFDYVFYLFLFSSFNLLFLGWINKYHLIPFNIKLSFKEWFGLAAITSFYNVITPFRGGLAARASYLKRKRGLNYSHFLSSLAALGIMMFIAPCILGIISLGILYYSYGIFNWVVFLIFLIGFFVFSSIFIMPKIRGKNKLIAKLNIAVEGWHEIKKHKKILLKIFLINLLQIFIGAVGMFFTYRVFGIDINFISGLLLVCMGILSGLIAITPANLGISEAIYAFSGLVVGINPVYSISAVVLMRVVHFVIMGVLGPIYSYILFNHNPIPK